MQDRHGHGKKLGAYMETDPTGRYARFNEVLGKGAVKTVYKAVDEVTGVEVAWNRCRLSQLLQSSEELQRLYSEVHLLTTLNHDSIIQFHAFWIDTRNRTFNFITEMFTSGTLREYRKKFRRIDMYAIKSWARQILCGLVYLHGHDPPVIHRDIKCDNIFVNGHLGQVKIGDLGLATILRGCQSAHSIIGTPEFMAPELYEEDYNELVDVYSFGMCVLEMLTAEYPYSECINPAQIYKKVTLGKLPRAFYQIKDAEAQRFIAKCLRSASDRLSAKDLLKDPFLQLSQPIKIGTQNPFLNDLQLEKLKLGKEDVRTNMTITGKLNPEDDTIFLKVQIYEENDSARNIYFPFDVLSDTPMDVANEMVKELEIANWDPQEIANMIDEEISILVPQWKKNSEGCSDSGLITVVNHENSPSQTRKDDSHADINSIDSGLTTVNNLEHGPSQPRKGSQSQILSPGSASDQQPKTVVDKRQQMEKCKLSRHKSVVDIRSQELHDSLMAEINKRRLFKTLGDVDDIGFKKPC